MRLQIKPKSKGDNTSFNVFVGKEKVAEITTCKNRGGQSSFKIDLIPGRYAGLKACRQALLEFMTKP